MHLFVVVSPAYVSSLSLTFEFSVIFGITLVYLSKDMLAVIPKEHQATRVMIPIGSTHTSKGFN